MLLQALAASYYIDRLVIVVGILAPRCQQDRNRCPEFPDCIVVAAGERMADRERSAGVRRIEMTVAELGSTLVDERLRRGEPLIDLS